MSVWISYYLHLLTFYIGSITVWNVYYQFFRHKRAHEDCSNDSISNKNCKKRCDDADRNYAKMMSYTSSMSVLAPDFCWNSQSKKRKSSSKSLLFRFCSIEWSLLLLISHVFCLPSELEKSKNESPEKLEKCRKICEESPNKNKDVSIQTTECVAQVSDVDSITSGSRI